MSDLTKELWCLNGIYYGTNAQRLTWTSAAMGTPFRETDSVPPFKEYIWNSGWQATGSTTPGGPHTHPESEITNLTTDLSGKLSTGHLSDYNHGLIHASESDNQDLSNLVVKVTNKSLVFDTEIAKIHAPGSDNQDLSGKVDKITGKGLSTNDYTTAEQTKVSNLSGTNTGDASGHAALAPLDNPTFTTKVTTPILAATGAITSSGGGIGYVAGAGGAVTQLTSRTTTVVLNKLCGNITMFSAAQAAAAVVSFTLTNSFIAATDIVIVVHLSATNAGCWLCSNVPAAGSCQINIKNISSGSITSATPLRFIVIKATVS